MNQASSTDPDSKKKVAEKPGIQDLSGTTLAGNYLLRKIIGQGGMATVYEAEQLNLKRMVALKLLRPSERQLRNDPECTERFLREASCGAALRSPNTITIYDYGTAPFEGSEVFYIVMERLKGYTLRQVLRAAGTLAPDRAMRVAMQVANALQEAHKQGFLHRDLKPGNVFLERNNDNVDQVKVLDFGLVKNLLESQENDGLTKQGILLGSPNYMSPEQVRSEPTDFRSDIYALGIIMYEMLTGRPPFGNKDNVQVLIAHTTEEPLPLLDKAPSSPPPLAQLVHSCLAKNPADRPASMDHVQAHIREILATYYPKTSGALPPLIDSHSQLSGSLSQALITHSGMQQVGGSTSQAMIHPSGHYSGALSLSGASLSGSAAIPVPVQGKKNNTPKIAAGVVAVLAVVLAMGALSRDSGSAASTAGRGNIRGDMAPGMWEAMTPEQRAAAIAAATEAGMLPSEVVPAAAQGAGLTINIQSEPLGATVTFAEHTCQTPCQMPLVQGEYQTDGVTLFTFQKDGYQDTSVSRRLSAPVTNISVSLVEDK